MRNDAAAVTFRLPRIGLVGLLLVVIAMAPVAFAAPGLQALYLLPLAYAVWLVRTSTAVGPDTIVLRRPLRTRRLAWPDVAGLRVDDRAGLRLVLHDGRELGLPAVRARDLPLLAVASGGRVADVTGGAGAGGGTGDAGVTRGRGATGAGHH